MLYGIKTADAIYITAASTLEEYEVFKNGDHEFPDGAEGAIVDILEMLTNATLKGLKASPYSIHYDTDATADAIIAAHNITIQRRVEAIDEHEDMLERAKLAEQALTPDRRTLAEVHGLTEDDPWSKRTDEAKEADKAEAERMQKIRDAGGLTSESFGGEQKEGVNVHSVKTTLDADNNVVSVNVMATKTVLSSYELTVPDASYLDKIFDSLRLPENRVIEQEDTRAVINLHSFQISQIGRMLDGVEFSLIRVEEDGTPLPDLVTGHNDIYLFFSINVPGHPVSNITFFLNTVGCDTSAVVASHDVNEEAMLFCINEAPAQKIADVLIAGGFPASVVAVNRRGQALLGAGANGKINDTNATKIDEPRPWNDRASEIDTMSEEEREELFKGIKASEFLFIVQKHPKHRTIAYITPESYFREHGKLWEGELPVLRFVPQGFMSHLEGSAFKCAYDYDLAGPNLSNNGFVESLLLQIHINENNSVRIAERSV